MMDRLFLDSNVLFSAAYQETTDLRRLWEIDAVLCSSRYALAEAESNLDSETQRRRLSELARSIEFFEAGHRSLPRSIALREKDVPILLAAIEAQAMHLITGDLRHFGRYFGKRLEGILVLPPAAYMRQR